MSSKATILYTLIGFHDTVLTDYYKNDGSYVIDTIDYVFPKLKDKGMIN